MKDSESPINQATMFLKKPLIVLMHGYCKVSTKELAVAAIEDWRAT